MVSYIHFLEIYFLHAADRVFGPATTTRHVYDVAAQQVVSGVMQGINGKYLTSLTLKECTVKYVMYVFGKLSLTVSTWRHWLLRIFFFFAAKY